MKNKYVILIVALIIITYTALICLAIINIVNVNLSSISTQDQQTLKKFIDLKETKSKGEQKINTKSIFKKFKYINY
jgi:membrane-associated HD superfamily phosphohydrolase